MGFREMRGGDGVSDVEIRRNEIIELLYTYKKYSMEHIQIPLCRLGILWKITFW